MNRKCEVLGKTYAPNLSLLNASITSPRSSSQFLSCIERVVAIEEQALQYEFDDTMTINDLVRIQIELFAVKSELVSQFQCGDIDGADAQSAFLNHANDASEMLTQMILHERSKSS